MEIVYIQNKHFHPML